MSWRLSCRERSHYCYNLIVLLSMSVSAVLVSASRTPQPSTVNNPVSTSTPNPSFSGEKKLVAPSTVNPIVVGIGVTILLILFGASFYYVIVWPKRSLHMYHMSIKNYYKDDEPTAEEVAIAIKNDSLASSPTTGGVVKNDSIAFSPPKRRQVHIPTMKEIEERKANEMQHLAPVSRLATVAAGGGGGERGSTPLVVSANRTVRSAVTQAAGDREEEFARHGPGGFSEEGRFGIDPRDI